jgi:hypothetical protein
MKLFSAFLEIIRKFCFYNFLQFPKILFRSRLKASGARVLFLKEPALVPLKATDNTVIQATNQLGDISGG